MQNIEIRDEIYKNIHTMKPSWWMKWGIAIVFLMIFFLFVLSYFIQYSETIIAEARISSKIPSVAIPAKTSASIASIIVPDGKLVKVDEYLIVLLTNANHNDIVEIKEKLSKNITVDEFTNFYENEKNEKYALGSVQSNWDNLLEFLLQYYEVVKVKKYDKKIEMLKKEIHVLEQRNTYL